MSETNVDVEAGFPTPGTFVATGGTVPSELPSGRLVTGLHTGPYERLGTTYTQMRAWATAHGLQPTTEMWEVYLTDPEREPDPDRWQTRVYLRVD
jgi:effector-binding domain-containing protein